MSNARAIACLRFAATTAAVVALLGAQIGVAQSPNWNTVRNSVRPLLGQPVAAPVSAGVAAPRRPIAHLIENPDQTTGAPPYALTDQTGTVQRYVEPVPGIDLAPYVGQVVVVRHDTGSTILASQLELPPQPLAQTNGDSVPGDYRSELDQATTWQPLVPLDTGVQLVQYVDDDDATVQLVPDDVPLPDGSSSSAGGAIPLEMIGPGGGYPAYGGPMGPEMMGPGYGPEYCDPMQCGPGPMQPYPQPMTACPQCGGYHGAYGPHAPLAAAVGPSEPPRSRFSADIEFNLLRPQLSEDAVGKLSEEYQFSPRIILAGRGLGNFDGRLRYWHFGRDTDVLGDEDVRFKFNVLDLEATHEFAGRRSELTLAAGMRLAGIHLTDINDLESGGDFFGLTMAADGLTPLGCFSGGYLGVVYGARLSILTGDWGGDDNSLFVDEQERGDNVLVHELYAGFELARRFRRVNLRARLDFEMQNWHSDVLAEDADIESIGFLGPGFQIGADF